MEKEKPVLMLKSATFAFKGRDILKKNGIKAYVERTPKKHDPSGCGYSLLIDSEEEKAVALLQSQGIEIMGSYTKS